MTKKTAWQKEAPFGIIVTDSAGIILEINDRSARSFEKDGGRELIGKNALACHPEPARSKLAALLAEGRSNIYTIEKNGVRKMIVQVPWYLEGRPSGLVELSIELPEEVPHFVRK